MAKVLFGDRHVILLHKLQQNVPDAKAYREVRFAVTASNFGFFYNDRWKEFVPALSILLIETKLVLPTEHLFVSGELRRGKPDSATIYLIER